MFYTYMLRCADDTLYTGWTTSLEDRLKVHNSGKGAKYTKARRPVVMVAQWAFETRSEAMKYELALKKLSRQEKLRLVLQQQQKARYSCQQGG